MKKAIVTIMIGEKYEKLAKLTHPTIKAYAEKVGADFIIWKDFIGHSLPAYKKLDIKNLLNEYDRVLYLDTDLIIRDDCPNLFDLVPEEKFGAFDEFPFTDRLPAMEAYKYDVDWLESKKYFNTGVFICSKMHKAVFNAEIEVNNFYEQTLMNYNIFNNNFKTFSLSYKFNRMTCLDWTGEDRFDSYIMHYAGCPLNTEAFLKQIESDLNTWKNKKDKYPRKIHLIASGGLGDQVCVEPVVRYVKETIYKNDNVYLTTHYPELFKHIDVIINAEEKELFGSYLIKLPPNSITYRMVNHILSHPVDAASIAAFKGQMSPLAKTIKLNGIELTNELNKLASNSVLIHAGKSWPTKTFPKSFWKEIVTKLVDNKVPVALIGKHVSDEFGYINLGKFDNPLVTDLRDKLTISELISVIKYAKNGLISNDSSPVHIAGAFENPIHLITIAKADYRILPFRRGQQYFKAYSYGKLLPFRFDPNCPEEVRVDKASEEEIISCLPDSEEIIQNILKDMKNERIIT